MQKLPHASSHFVPGSFLFKDFNKFNCASQSVFQCSLSLILHFVITYIELHRVVSVSVALSLCWWPGLPTSSCHVPLCVQFELKIHLCLLLFRVYAHNAISVGHLSPICMLVNLIFIQVDFVTMNSALVYLKLKFLIGFCSLELT